MYYSTLKELIYRDKNQNPIKVAIAGSGFIGGGLIIQLGFMQGVRIVAVANRNIDKALKAISQMNKKPSVCICSSLKEIKEQRSDQILVTSNPLYLVETDADIIVDTTGDTVIGAELAYASILSGKHFVANAEMDITVGPYLSRLAKETGVVYSGAEGDEPGVIMGMYNWAKVLGLNVVAAGKFKNYTNMYSNPATVKPWADRYQQNPYKIASFADGSKMSVEMGLVANATGLVPDVPGMHVPEGTLDTVTKLLCDKSNGGILNREGVVEIVSGVNPSGGVFIVVKTEHPQVMSDLKYYKMGDGPYYMFYRPYHLCSFEMATGIIDTCLKREPVICPLNEPVADVIAIAKKDLEPGTILDSFGGYTFTGKLDLAQKTRNLLPAGLAAGARVLRPIQQGDAILMNQVELDENTRLFLCRRKMGEISQAIDKAV